MSTSAEFWLATQQILQNPDDLLVEKPRLTDKLLSKPPFRFLHDIISAVQSKTGFAPGLFVGQELDGHAIQDKESKVAYLNKIIAVVSLVLNQPVPAKPLKIVAGLEPENTNVFLQMLGRAARMGTAADAVQRVLAGQGAELAAAQPTASNSGARKQTQAAQHGQPQQQSAVLGKSGSGGRRMYSDTLASAAAEAPQAQTVPAQQLLQQHEAATLERPHSRRLSRDVSHKQQQQQEVPPVQRQTGTQESAAGGNSMVPAAGVLAPQQPPALELARPPSSSSSRVMSAKKPPPLLASSGASVVKANSPQGSVVARPASGLRSAGRTPPGSLDAHTQLARPPSAGMSMPSSSSSRDAATNILGKAVGTRSGHKGRLPVQVDSSSDGDDDGPVQDLLADDLMGVHSRAVGLTAETAAAGAQGVLVKDILSAEEQLRKAGADAAAAATGDQEDYDTGIILTRQAKPTGSTTGRKPKDLAAMAEAVQKLCQVALPLARSLEFLQEDVDSMSKEYRFWVTERRVFQERLLEEQKAAADTSHLEARVAEQDAAIRASKARILALRSQVLHGEEQINKLLQTVVAGSR